jgi:glycosyltransferase involved in cell wall biosynthesis
MPIRNEEDFIARSLGAVLAQDYPADLLDVIVVDGQSTDRTAAIVDALLEARPNARRIENPGRVVAKGLNLALGQARGDVFIRVDGHCEIAPDYVRNCVQHLTREAVDGVGGPLETVGEGSVSRAIALAMSSRFGVGGSPFRTHRSGAGDSSSRLVDSIAFPAYWRRAVDQAGPFDEELVRNQDDEYNYRLRKLGAKLLLADDVRCRYFSRASFGRLWKQYFEYGFWKVRVLQKHPRQMRARQFAPPLLVAALLAGLGAAPFSAWGRRGLGAVAVAYAASLAAASVGTARKNRPVSAALLGRAFATLHLAYGGGFLVGLVRFWNRWRLSDEPGPSAAISLPDSSRP